MNYALIGIYLTSIILLIATPGPVVALVLHAAAQNGFRHAVLKILGTNAASLVLIFIAALIISGVFVVHDMLLAWISLVGCLFIGWLAFQALQKHYSKPQAYNSQNSDKNPSRSPLTSKSAIINGFLVGISNPKDIIFFVAFFPQFINVTGQFQTSLALLTFMWILCDFLILFLYVTVINVGIFQHFKRLISFLSSSFLLFIAVTGFIYTVFTIFHS